MIWFFDRGDERLVYTVRRAAGDDAYELQITYPDGRSETERTPDAAELLERCAAAARKLAESGWRAR